MSLLRWLRKMDAALWGKAACDRCGAAALRVVDGAPVCRACHQRAVCS